MKVDFKKFKIINGMWFCAFDTPLKFDFLMRGADSDLKSQQMEPVEIFFASFETYIDEAYKYVHQSVYLEDVKRHGGITLNSIDFESLYEFRIWFNFQDWIEGMVGVWFKKQKPHSVYCDN